MKNKLLLSLIFLSLLSCYSLKASKGFQPHYSTAGFYTLEGTGREVYSMNPAWRFYKGDIKGAESLSFNDKSWDLVSLPNGIELLPSEASGCVNYQGVVWYRKHFHLPKGLAKKQLFLHFEAIMGKSKVWVNGQLVAEHYGGYLPIVIDVTKHLSEGEENLIAVMADNSDDPIYPPGKPQDMLDFTYAGGIYRDCWLVAHNNVFITDPNYEDQTAGGGLFVAYNHVSEKSAMIKLATQVRNAQGKAFSGRLEYRLLNKDGKEVLSQSYPINISDGKAETLRDSLTLKTPQLWSPEKPYLYKLCVYIKNQKGKVIDGYYRRIGIRSIEFKGAEGLWINGKAYNAPLIGANRHQDFAVVGNALSNSQHWRDAKKLRDAGLKVIRNAHYPQDPAFMDACDELGLFVIVNTPGWQFWNKEPIFEQRVYQDIRNMVRRDRNHPSVFLWEPILNETWYPDDFAYHVVQIIKEEYPYPYCYYACDSFARGNEYFPVLFRHPPIPGDTTRKEENSYKEGINYFTREWGDNVDNWNSHNSNSRVSRSWGEVPMLIQSRHYARPSYEYTCYNMLYRTPRQHVGGCLWHSFDHQRGYHPDPFYGGIMDNFRQAKYSYYMFCAQRSPEKDTTLIAETGPMIYIANAMTPFSPSDITVFSNCDEVKLTYCKDGEVYHYRKEKKKEGMPSPIINFKGVSDFMKDKKYTRGKRMDDYYLLAEGYVNGKLAATDTVYPARRATHLRLHADNEGMQLVANGSDIMTIIASVTDDRGTVKRLNESMVRFEISGPAELISSADTFTNPRAISWGTAPILIRSTTQAGEIKIKASLVWQGKETPIPGEITLKSIPATHKYLAKTSEIKEQETMLFSSSDRLQEGKSSQIKENKTRKNQLKIVEQQQERFENKH